MADTPERRQLLAKMREAGACFGQAGSEVALAQELHFRAALEEYDRNAPAATSPNDVAQPKESERKTPDA